MLYYNHRGQHLILILEATEMKKTFKVEKGRGKSKVVQFVELTTSEEDIKNLANFAWCGWKIEEVKK